MRSPPRFNPIGIQPTPEQLDIQSSQARTLLIEANAGAAKTTTLALRIGESLARKLPPSEILALTFTDEAKNVLAQRLREIGIPAAIASQVRIETFERFSSDTLEKLEGYRPQTLSTPKALKPYVIKAIEQVAKANEGRSEAVEVTTHNLAISQFLATQLSMKATLSALRDLDYMDSAEAAETLDVPHVHYLTYQHYEELRCGIFDEPEFRGPFDATFDLARRLSDSSTGTLSRLPSYRVILCDELHDLNEASFRVLRALLVRGKSYFAGAGDKDQVIYETLGAHSQYLEYRFNEYDPNLVRLPLTAAFRYGQYLARSIGNLKSKESSSQLALKTEIQLANYPVSDRSKCGSLVTQSIIDRRKEFPLESVAVLIRERHHSIEVENALMLADIGYQPLKMKSYLHREEILFLRGMIAIALKNLDFVHSQDTRKAIVAALQIFGEVNLSQSDLEQGQRTVADTPETLEMFFTGQLLNSKGEVRNQIFEVVEFLKALSADEPADKALEEICRILNLDSLVKRIYIFPYEASVVTQSIRGFIASAKTLGKGLREFSEWIGKRDAIYSRYKKSQFVTLDCIANVKGMEFDHVIIPFLEDGEFPDYTNDLAGDENLFYVGATRPRSCLTLVTTVESRRQSPFIKKLGLKSGLLETHGTPTGATLITPRRDLNVPFFLKDEAKSLGARWDAERRTWYIPAGMDQTPFTRWMS